MKKNQPKSLLFNVINFCYNYYSSEAVNAKASPGQIGSLRCITDKLLNLIEAFLAVKVNEIESETRNLVKLSEIHHEGVLDVLPSSVFMIIYINGGRGGVKGVKEYDRPSF